MHGIPRLVGLQVGDEADPWREVGFEVRDDRFAVGGVTVELTGGSGRQGILAWSLEHPEPFSVDGLSHVEDIPEGGSARHPNGATALDHVVVTTSNLERTTQALQRLGITPRRTVQDVRGRGLAYRFFLLGTCILELIGPPESVADEPARFSGLAFATPDVEHVARTVAGASDVRDAIQPGRRIVTVDTHAAGISAPLAFLTPRP